MPYTEASIRETTRIYPITPLGIPRTCIEDTTLGGYFIPKGTLMLPCFWSAHRDLQVWQNPEKFQPERFLDQDGNLLKKDFSIAFGAGKTLILLNCSLKKIYRKKIMRRRNVCPTKFFFNSFRNFTKFCFGIAYRKTN